MNNSLLFDLVVEARKWKTQTAKLLSAFLGLSLLCLLTVTAIQMRDVLIGKPPSWAVQTKQLVSISRLEASGTLDGLSDVVVEAVSEFSSVKQVGTVMEYHGEFTHPLYTIPKLTAVLFDEGLLKLFEPKDLSNQTEGVWISHQAWKTIFNQQPLTEINKLYHHRIENGLPVIGVLPKAYDYFGPLKVDIYMPQSVYRNFTPFGNDFMIDKFLRAEPNKHIFAEVDNSFNEEEVRNYLNQGAFDVPGMKMIGEGGETLVAEGFVRSPSQQEQLTFKWRLIVFLIIAFLTIVAINLISLFSSHVTLHANELKTMQILGAPASVVLKSLFVSITMLSAGVILAVASSIVPFLELANIVLFSSLDSKPKLVFQPEPLFWVVLFTIISLYILGFLSSKVDLGSLFSRQMGVSANKWQKRVVWSFQYIQYVVSLITLMAVLFIAINFFRNSDEYLDLEEAYLVDVTAKGLSGILDYLGAEGEEKSFAVSVTSFVNKHTTKLEDKSLPKGTQAHVFYVSNNYFFVLAGQDTSELWGNKVIVNKAMADLLSDDGFIIGSSLDMGELLGVHVIADVSDNLPHDGMTHSAIPAVYMPLGSMRNRDINGLQVVVPKETATEHLLWLKSWLSENTAEYDLSDPLLIQQRIKQVDREEQSMLLLGLNVVILILISIFLNLYYDVKTRLSLEKQDFSVMLAVGAPDRAIISNLVINQLVLLLAASVTLLLLMLFQSEWLGAYPKYLLLSIIPICASALFAIALVSAYAPFYKFKSSSIYSNLRM